MTTPVDDVLAVLLREHEILRLRAEVERYRADLLRLWRGDQDGEMGYLAYQSLLFGLAESPRQHAEMELTLTTAAKLIVRGLGLDGSTDKP